MIRQGIVCVLLCLTGCQTQQGAIPIIELSPQPSARQTVSRAVSENASLGTDHGSVGPVFLMGARVKSGLHGNAPDLTELQDGELKLQFDFRQIYASILEDWFSIPSQTILAGSFSKPNIL